MSTELATKFGAEHGGEYRRVLLKWAKRLKGSQEISDEARAEWRIDLHKALGDEVTAVLRSEPRWKALSGSFADKDTLDRFAKIAAKGALTVDTDDLLNRLVRITNTVPPDTELQGLADELAGSDPSVILAGGTITVLVLSKRVYETVSQIFDMAADRFSRLIGFFLFRKKKASGRRRWVTNSLKSRHKSLNGQIKEAEESFIYKGQAIYGPRPPGGSPDNWSNCSCTLVYERADGDWA